MNTKSFVLRAAMVTALGTTIVAPSIANADIIKAGAPAVLASELVKGTGQIFAFDATNAFEIDISDAAGLNISDTTPMEIRLTLTNGATFNAGSLPAATDFVCDYSGAVANTAVAANVLGGTVGTTTVTYKLPAGDIAGTSPVCRVKGSLEVKLASGQKDYTIGVTGLLKASNPANSVNIVTAGSFVTFQQSYAVSVTPKSVTVDVAAPSLSQKFTDSQTTVLLGTIAFAEKATVATPIYTIDTKELVATFSETDLLTSVNIIVTGTPLVPGMMVSLIEKGQDCDIADVVVLAAAGATTPTANKTATVSGVTFSELQAADFAAGVDVCYTVDGNTRLEKGKVSFEITPGTVDGANLGVADNTLANVYKNGTSVKVLNIPNEVDTTDAGFIRIYNFGSSSAKVYGTMYEWDKAGTVGSGKQLGNKGVEIATVPSNGVKVLKVSDLKSLFTVTTWSGRAWMQIEGDSQQIRVQSLVRSMGIAGPLINFSERILEDNGSFCRSGTCK
jgi:hypothetical protein